MKNESYEEFVEKFKPKKTTDGCYTPPEVYKVIKDWVCRRYGIDPEKIIRPFWPGADYRAMEYPDYIVTTAMMQKMAKYGIEYQVEKRRSLFVRSLDAQKAMKKAIFGGGLLLAEKAAAEKAAAEKASTIVFELSEREKDLVRQLGM